MKPYLSLVIPYYNSADTVSRLLATIFASRNAPIYEVIIVDDGSRKPLTVSMLPLSKKPRGREVRIVTLRHNMGPAAARNHGAKAARGAFIVFLDSDVELFPDTLHNLAAIFRDDPDVVALTGVWVKEQRTDAFFPNFKALRDWSYWINERDKSGYYFLFSTRIASIKKAVFMRLGGFDERYPGALVEDIELTYRIARRYAIIFAPNVRVRHEFENFWPIAKKYFLRAYHWTKLYAKRKKFDPVATTVWEAISALSGTGTVVLGFMSLASLPALPLVLSVAGSANGIFFQLALATYVLFAVSILVHAVMVRKFLQFLYREKGASFAVRGFFMGLVLYCFIAAGALWGKLKG